MTRRDAWFPETGWADTAVYSRYSLAAGDRFSGPAVVEERESTLVVPPAAAVSVLDDLSLEVRFG